jgi:hypothetical protein
MTNKDINIDNYTYVEMLEVYGVTREFKATIIDEMDTKLRKIREKLPVDYYVFYLKVHRIIWTVHQLFIKNVIQDELNLRHIEYYVGKIKTIADFETMNPAELFNHLGVVSATDKSQQQQHSRKEVDTINEESKPVLKDSTMLINSYPYPIGPTNLNSIKRVTQFKNLCFNSCFRHNYYQTTACNYQYTIPSEIKHVVSMRLASIELPNTWSLFSKRTGSSSFIMSVTNGDTTTDYLIEIPSGNFDSDAVSKYLNQTYFYQSTTVDDLSLFMFSVDESTFKTTISFYTGTNPTNISYNLCFLDDMNHNIMNTFGWIMGFRLANYYNITGAIESEGLFDAAGDRYIYMAINDYQKNTNSLNMVCFDNSVMEEDIIGKIPITTGKLSIFISENNNLVKTRKYNGPVNIRNLHIRLLDKFGDVLDLNNMDFSFTLEFEILYEKFHFQDMR